MGLNRGKRKDKRGKLKWNTKNANSGRRPTLGKRKHFTTWSEVRQMMKANETRIVPPSQLGIESVFQREAEAQEQAQEA